MRNYERYLYDYVQEHDSDLASHLIIEDDEDDEIPDNKVYKVNYAFKETLQSPYITPKLQDQQIQDKIIDFTGRFMDQHADQLSTAGPVYTFTFGPKEVGYLYNLFEITQDNILASYEKVVEETYYGKLSSVYKGLITKVPHKILLCSMLVDSIQHNHSDIVECVEYLFAFTEYPLLYRKYWSTGVRPDVMAYTIEHLSPKFKIRQFKNILGLLKYDTTTVITSFNDRLKQGADNVYMDLIYYIRNQINSKFRNLSKYYYDNAENNRTQHAGQQTLDDGKLIDQEGMATMMAQTIDQTINKFSTSDINQPMVILAASICGVDKSNLSSMIAQIYATKNNKVEQFIEAIITYYFQKNPGVEDINNREFLDFGFTLYRSIGTSKDETLAKLKSIELYWMNDIIGIRNMYGREATIISYSRAVWNYMVLIINAFQ